jgi:GMP synthase-like glutamine amidotransferase
MRIHVIQHVSFETEGSIARWATDNGHSIDTTALFAEESPPRLEGIDWLILMGGPLGADDEKKYPWLAAEKAFIERAFSSDLVITGVCLGAQLIASVLGARVYANRDREIGWWPIELTDEAVGSPLFRGLPRTLESFHWHGDTFDLPAGSTRLARSEACENQVFAYGSKVLGIQCHFEMTGEIAAALVAECANDLECGPFAQGAEEILGDRDRFDGINKTMSQLLTRQEGVAVGQRQDS